MGSDNIIESSTNDKKIAKSVNGDNKESKKFVSKSLQNISSIKRKK